MVLIESGFFNVFLTAPCFHQISLNHKKTGGVLRAGDSPPPGSFRNKGDCSPLLAISYKLMLRFPALQNPGKD